MTAQRFTRYEYASVERTPEGETFLDEPYPTPKAILLRDATPHVVREGETIWSLAWAQYEKILDREQDIRPTAYDFAIAWANDIVDPLEPLTPGSTIYLPSIETLFGEVLAPPRPGQATL